MESSVLPVIIPVAGSALQQVSRLPPAALLLLFACALVILAQYVRRRKGAGAAIAGRRLPPGPRQWPVVGNLLQVGPVPHHGMKRLTDKYGPLVYLKLGTVHAVVTDEPRLVREFLKKQDHIFASRPKNIASEYFTYGGQDIAFSPYGQHWRSMRRLCLFELLTPKRLEYFRQGRMEELSCMVRGVLEASQAGEAVNLRDSFGGLSSNLLTRMILGKRFFGVGDAGPKEAARHKANIYAGFALTNAFNVADYLPFLRPFDLQGRERDMRKIMAFGDNLYDSVLEEHRQNRAHAAKLAADAGLDPTPPTNFVDLLLSLPGEDGQPMLSQTTIKAIIIDLVAAGTDTSSITSEWTMAELIRHPEMMKRARQEIEEVVGKGTRVVEEGDLPKLNYLKAVVKETFRLHPVGAFLIPHVSLQDTHVEGYFIPKDTRILINTYSLGRNPCVWERPTEFCPDRFFSEHVELNDPDLRIVPFGAGRRGCPGATLGTNVVLLGLAKLIQAFDWAPAPNSDPDLKEAYGLMILKTPLHAVATPRLPSHLY